MRPPIIAAMLVLFLPSDGVAQTAIETAIIKADTGKFKFAAILGYNFGGKGDLSNLTPEIFFGFDTALVGNKLEPGTTRFRIGPSASSGPGMVDSLSMVRSLMLPGNVSVAALFYHFLKPFRGKTKLFLTTAAGLKVIAPPTDSAGALVQQNLRLGGGIQLLNLFVVGAQYTWAWHDLTSDSQRNFERVFERTSTSVQYATLTVESLLPAPVNAHLYLVWRRLSNVEDFRNGAKDRKIVSIGLRKDLSVAATAPTLSSQ